MNVIAIASIIGILTLLVGFLIMFLMTRFSVAIVNNEAAIDRDAKERQAINPQVTKGHSVNAQADVKEQLVQARLLAATQAAGMERGENMGIGRLATTDAIENKKTASKGVDEDAITAVKIAHFHTWQGLTIDRTKLAAPTAVAATASTKMVKRKLEAGKDYPVVAITDAMSPQEKRTARIANAKAKSGAYKALKESGQMMVAEAVAAPAAAAPVVDTAASAAAANIPEPVLVELTDDMSPEDKRSARIANSKAKSAYKKALKAAGIDPKAAKAAPAAPVPVAAAPAPEAAVADAATLANIPVPDLIELTDDMAPDDKRAARIANSKAKSAYKKALKAAGIDPKTVKI